MSNNIHDAPVAWLSDDGRVITASTKREMPRAVQAPYVHPLGHLSAHPPVDGLLRQALTDEEIDLIANDGMRNAAGGIHATRVHDFARAGLRAATSGSSGEVDHG